MARRSRKPWKPPVGVSKGVGSVLQKLSLGGRLVEMRVLEAWADAVGDSIARRSVATALDRGTLHVTVENPTWKNELVYIEKDIVKRVNERILETTPPGSTRNPVRNLRLHVGAVEAPVRRAVRPRPDAPPPPTADMEREVERRIADLEDPDVREAARRLLLRSLAQDAQDAQE